jgi:hexulose-6-phosphate isomerase
MSTLGIMQGRLVPPPEGRFQCFPREAWEREFSLAADAGLEAIEWIFDAWGEDVNPLTSDAGISAMKAASQRTGVAVKSLCADYFMDFPLVRVAPADREQRLAKLRWLLDRCRIIGITRVVLPFVDASKIESETDRADVTAALLAVLPAAEKAGVELHLETSLAPSEFAALLARIPHPMVKVNYDSGNSSSLGYDPRDEFAAYGSRVGSVHIKDRIRGGGTVPLGKGDANLPALFTCLASARYRGDFILQVARSTPGDEVNWARHNRDYVLPMIRSLPRD